ncbi:MAG TPA: hypothetical protein VMR81_06645 [Patescibacteria group bacterium]|nr:hypothetical protein [Patescibacteria group bacterium]
MIQEGSDLWKYLSPSQQALAHDGAFLVADSDRHLDTALTDYSYLVFPFAKLYEGFLKQLLLDLGIMTEKEYRSDHYRVGKTLSPSLVGRLGHKSAFGEIERRIGGDLAIQLWQTWKNGRNLVFHYFPHNYRALTHEGAKEIIDSIVTIMERAIEETNVHRQTLG